MSKERSRVSASDNEAAGRLLLVGVFGVIGFMLLLISPILIGGFLIGLIWYGAFMESGEPSGGRVVWPVVITLMIFIYLIGLFPPFEHHIRGVLFNDFSQWTWDHVRSVMMTVNSLLPRKLELRVISELQIKTYIWCMIPVSIASFIYLHRKGTARGVGLYELINICFTPVRIFASNLIWIAAFGFTVLLASFVFNLPPWFLSFVSASSVLMSFYHYAKYGFGGNSNGVEKPEVTSGPLLLGIEKGKAKKVSLSDEQLNHHVHIVGASGFGKSVLLSHMIKNRIQNGSGLLFVDLKADFETIRQVVSTSKGAGRLDDLYIFSCGNPAVSSPYNVVGRGTANQLKDRIMGALNWSEEFYKNEASSFLLKLLRGLVAVRDLRGQSFDLGTILECASNPRKILDVIRDLPESEQVVRSELEGLVTQLAKPDQLRSLQGLRSQLESLLLSDFGHLLKANENGVDLFEAIQKKKIIYILLDSRTYGESAKALGKLILQDLKAASAKIDAEVERAKRIPFTVVVDEFSDMASEDFIGFLDRARSSKIGIVMAHQELADLSRISPEFASRLMNSTSTLFAFLQKLPDSSELISGICGTRKTKEVTEQAKSNWIFGDEKTGMKSIKEVDEFVIHPNVIRSLGVGECVLVQKYPSSKAMLIKVKAESKNYLEEKEVREILAKIATRYTREKTMVRNQKVKSMNTEDNDSYWNNKSNKGNNLGAK